MKLSNPLTSAFDHDILPPAISGDGVEMSGVYPHRQGFKVYFRGDWFYKDEHGRPFKAEFYAYSFREQLKALYDPDPAKNRYDPSKFKDRTPHKFDEAFPLYLDRTALDSSWSKSKEYIWKKYFMPFFANQDFRTIDSLQLQGFKRWLEEKGLKGKTIRNILMILHGFLRCFKSMINLFPDFPPVKYQRPRIRWFTDKEIDQVFEFIEEEDRGYFLFLRYYGARPEEASGLLRSAINWETREIIISTVYVDGRIKQRTKNKDERPLPIIPEMEPYLMRNGECGMRNESIFVFNLEGKPYTRHIRERRWKRAMRQAIQTYSTRAMTLRDLRHSAATRWRRAGTRIEDIQKLLGHSDSRVTTEFYADVATHDLISIVRGK